jgi:hypothetical protein
MEVLLEVVLDLSSYEGRERYIREHFGEMVDVARNACFTGTKLSVSEALEFIPEVVQRVIDEFHALYDPQKGKSPKNFIYERAAWRAMWLLHRRIGSRPNEFSMDFKSDFLDESEESVRLLKDEPGFAHVEFMADMRMLSAELSEEARGMLHLLLDGMTVREAGAELGLRRPDPRGPYVGKKVLAVLTELQEKMRERHLA